MISHPFYLKTPPMSLDTAIWPAEPIQPAIKDLLTKFYACVDAPQDPNANVKLADEVFAPGATFTINQRVIKGRDAIVNWRGNAASGNRIKISIHTVEKVYVLNNNGQEILTTGTLYLEMTDGVNAVSNYAARGLVADVPNGEDLKFKEWQGWVDYMPYFQAGMFEAPRLYEGEERK